MRRPNITLMFCISLLAISSAVWSKGQIIRIEVAGDGLSKPIDITNPDILGHFNIWNGPGVSYRGPDGDPYPPAYLDRSKSVGRFINWPEGMAAEKPPALQRVEVTFYVGEPGKLNIARKYVFAYEIDTAERGYIYLPRWKNSLISHGVEGNWFYASERWNGLLMPIIAQHSTQSSASPKRNNLNCKVGDGSVKVDGTIEFVLLDKYGKKTSRWRYETSMQEYQSVKAHIGNVEPGEEIEISCWPARS